MIFSKITFSFIFTAFCHLVVAQNAQPLLHYYPHGQESYEGGELAFYKDFHTILMDKQLKPCENKNEMYLLKVIVNEDATIKYVKDDTNSEMAITNKCTYDLGLKVVSQMKKWQPATIDGVKQPAIASYYIYPEALFENYKEGYVLDSEPATFEGLSDGMNRFRSQVVKKIDLYGFQWKQSFKLVVLFTVNAEGNIEDVKLENSSGLPEFDKRVINGIKSVKKKWKPANIQGFPVKYRFKLPLIFGNPG